jgi:hypothetical protein
MATTTNYGWTTPDDTALVKDGASAIRSLGTSVDTTTKNLNPSTTLGDIEYRSSTANVNTRLPLGTAGQVLKVNSGATAPEWATDATGMTNPMTTTGDTIYSSSGSTPARLAIGSTGNVLTVAGGVPTWAAPAAGGKVLQVVQGTTTTSTTVASTSFTDTTLTATITPSSATSKILIIFSQSAAWGRGAEAQGASVQLLRGASVVYSQDGNGGGFNSDFAEVGTLSNPKGWSRYFYANGTYLDSPATTSATTYKTQGRCVDTANSGNARFQPNDGRSTITLMEIGA